jgi:putative phage-type endonuclease
MIKQDTPEWLELRKKKVTATDARTLMGKNDYKTPYQLWRQKQDLDPPEPENWAMKQGKLLEPIARAQLMEQLDIELLPVVRFSRTVDWAMASLDGLSPDGKILVEIKCPTTMREEIVPDIYYPQLQHQLYICELDKMFYFNFFEGNTFLIEVRRDDAYIENMLTIEKDFYECMLSFSPPKLTKKDYIERTDDEFYQAASHFKSLEFQLKDLEKKHEHARQSLILLSRNSNSRGFGVDVSKIVRKGNIDYSNVKELQGVDLEPYRKKPIESWRVN